MKPLHIYLLKTQTVSLFAEECPDFLLGALVEVFGASGLMFHKPTENAHHAVVVNADFVAVLPINKHIFKLVDAKCINVILCNKLCQSKLILCDFRLNFFVESFATWVFYYRTGSNVPIFRF